MSLLSWERGLKFNVLLHDSETGMSLLSWERGLKYVRKIVICGARWVAPLVGAWIEIWIRHGIVEIIHVAPLVGAWIEIWNRIQN